MMNRLPLLIALLFLFSCSRRNEKSPLVETKNEIVAENVSSNVFTKIEQQELSSASHLPNLVLKSILSKVDVLVPDEFVLMAVDKVVVIYPSKQTANFQVYTDEDATVNLAFEHTSNKIELQDLPMIKQVFEQQFNQTGIDFCKSEIQKINGREFIVIEMITATVHSKIYNLMFLTSSEGRLLIGTFNCTIDKIKEWQPIAAQILSSVRVREH